MLPPSYFRCEMHTHRKDKPLSPCFRCREVPKAPVQALSPTLLLKEVRPLLMIVQQAIKNKPKPPSEQHNHATNKKGWPCRLHCFRPHHGPKCHQPQLAGRKLEQNFLSVSASRLSPACDEQVACPSSRRNRPRSGLRIFGPPCHTPQPTLERARPPLQAKPAPSALLA